MTYTVLTLYAITFIFSLLETHRDRKSIAVMCFTISSLVLIMLLSWLKPIGLGFDDKHYFEVLAIQCSPVTCELKNPYNWEVGYSYLNYISSKLFGSEFGALILIVVTISMLCNILGFKKLSPLLALPLLWYLSHLFLYKEMTQVRSAIAYSMLFLSFSYIYERKYVRSSLLILLASTFHISSLIGFLVLFINRVSLKVILCSLVLAILLSTVGVLDFLLIEILKVILPSGVFSTYVTDTSGFAKSVGLLNPTTLKYLIFTFLFFILRKGVYDIDLYRYCLKVYILSPIWAVVFSSFGTLAGRPASIFSIMEGVLLAHIACSSSYNGLLKRMIIVVMCFCLLLINFLVIKPINLSVL